MFTFARKPNTQQAAPASPGTRVLQTKRLINRPGDEYEQEADQLAEQMTRLPDRYFQHLRAGGEVGSNDQTRPPGPKPERLQTKHVSSSSTGKTIAAPIVEEGFASPGQPLDPATRAFMQTRFSYDFSHVRVHTGLKAAESARTVNALAFTVGRDIVFGDRQFAPRTMEGRQLLAHELVHVMQQSSDTRPRAHGSLVAAADSGQNIGYVQRQAAPQSPGETERLRQESIIERDAFDLCAAAHSFGFIPAVTEAVVEQAARAMRAAIVHHVPTMSEFESIVEEHNGMIVDLEAFRRHHRNNLAMYSITGQTVVDRALREVHIMIVGSHALSSAQEFVLRHERGHAALISLGVPIISEEGIQERILESVGLGIDRIPHLGIRIR